MTDIERLEKFQKLKDMINGPEADEFKNYWDGRFFTGDMTFVFDKIYVIMIKALSYNVIL